MSIYAQWPIGCAIIGCASYLFDMLRWITMLIPKTKLTESLMLKDPHHSGTSSMPATVNVILDQTLLHDDIHIFDLQ